MRKLKRGHRLTPILIAISLVFLGLSSWFTFCTPTLHPWWKKLTRESRRILGLEKAEIPLEEKRIREEVILKKMGEAIAHQDWRTLAPEYPWLKKLEAPTEEEKMRALRNSPEFKEMERELKGYLRKKEDLFKLEPPVPSFKDAADSIPPKDRGAEKVIERLLSTKERTPQEKPLDENFQLGMRGPLNTRKILERPQPPQVKVRVEVEIELTLWVLPNGVVDRVIPIIKGDTELERIAIQYLKQWRFAPLLKDQPQVEQWGTIPVKFKLQ